MPDCEPSHTTRHPEPRRTSATARPGNTWPPVPPAAIMTVLGTAISLRDGSRAHPAHDLAVFPVDPEEDGDRRAVREQPASAEAHERQREALRRQHAHVHAHV